MVESLTLDVCVINKEHQKDVLNVISHRRFSTHNIKWFKKKEDDGYKLLHELREYYLIA